MTDSSEAVAAPDEVAVDQNSLRATIEALAPIDRTATSPGEREAAEWIAGRLEQEGCEVAIDAEPAYDSFADSLAALTAAGAVAGAAALTRRGRLPGMVGGALAAAGIADDISNGPRLFRRATKELKETTNVVAQAGDPGGGRTLVVLAHHDAAPTGRIFDPTLQRRLAQTFPGIIERVDTSLPQWWPAVAGPGLVALGAARRRRGLVALGLLGSAASTALLADIARSPTVPGASDNLSAVAALVELARALRERPVEGVRVILASCGAEETLQGGIKGFTDRHLRPLPRERTWVLNLDTLGSPQLVMLEGEGPLVMEDYHQRGFRDLVARVAERERIPLRRGMRARSSTDAVIPSRAGFPTATLVSMNRHKALSHYHLPSDTPENVVYRTVARATAVAEAVARELSTGRIEEI